MANVNCQIKYGTCIDYILTLLWVVSSASSWNLIVNCAGLFVKTPLTQPYPSPNKIWAQERNTYVINNVMFCWPCIPVCSVDRASRYDLLTVHPGMFCWPCIPVWSVDRASRYDLLTVHPGMIFVNNQLDPQFFFLYLFISILYMFRAAMCPSSGEVLYQCDTWFMSVCVCRCPSGMQVSHSYNNSPDNRHMAARNM